MNTMQRLLCFLLLSLIWPSAQAAYLIETVAGTGKAGYNSDRTQATQAALAIPTGVAIDAAGNLYIADRNNHRVRKVAVSGEIITLAGTGTAGYSGDNGFAVQAQLQSPGGVAVAADGSVYIADTGNHVIRKVDANGVISTIAGTGSSGRGDDKLQAIQSALNGPMAVAVGPAGLVYFSDTDNQRIRKIAKDGTVSTIAGVGWSGFDGDGGPAIKAKLKNPKAIAVDAQGNVYITDSGNSRVRKIDTAGNISTIAGSTNVTYSGDGAHAQRAALDNPQGVAVDSEGRIFISDSFNHRIRMIDAEGIIHTIAGSGFIGLGSGGDGGDGGIATTARLFNPYHLAVSVTGVLYVADSQNSRIRRLSPDYPSAYRIETYAGANSTGLTGGGYSGDDGPAVRAHMKALSDLALDSEGNLYIADTGNHRIRKVDTKGVISTVAGRGIQGYDGDGGPALQAMLKRPAAVAVDRNGLLYIADTDNQRIRKIDARGVISSIAGSGETGFAGDNGQAVNAKFNKPQGIAVDGAGNLYIADSGNHRIRKVDANGLISTIAGSGVQGFSGDGGAATAARLNEPSALVVDDAGTVYFADRRNYRIRKISNGKISTVAGTGQPRYSLDQQSPLSTALFNPIGLAMDRAGNLYVSEYQADRVRRISPEGVVVTVAGNGSKGFMGDGGEPTAALLDSPRGLAINATGSQIFIADSLNHRVRKVSASSRLLRIQREGNGQVSAPVGLGKGIACGELCSEDYLDGQLVTLTATPNEGFEFAGWDGACSGTDSKIQIRISADMSCSASFSTKNTGNPVALQTSLSCDDIELPPAYDLSAQYGGASVLDAINQVPDMQANNYKLTQDRESGQAYLALGAVSLVIRPVALEFQSHPASISIDEQQSIRVTTDTGLLLRFEPMAQGLCQLKTLFQRLGVGRLSMSNDGNLSLPITEQRRLSLRPDWMMQTVDAQEAPGLFFSQDLVTKGQITASMVFVDTDQQKRRQYLYPAPAQLAALFSDTEKLSFEPLGVLSFTLGGKTYRGLPDYVVIQNTPPAGGKLSIEPLADQNDDGKDDFTLHYPNGETQILFAL